MRTTPLLACWLAVGFPALAMGEDGGTERIGDPCSEDIMSLCPDIEPGSARVVTCLREKEAQLTPSCRQKMEADTVAAKQLIEGFARACRTDFAQLCADVDPGGGRGLVCLAEHRAELSSPCQAELARIDQARERVAVFRKACAQDIDKLCKVSAARAGPLLQCLQANEASLSDDCHAAQVREIAEASTVVDTIEEMTRDERSREVLQVLQGLDSVAFSRSQVLLQFDVFEGVKNQANAGRLLFSPQFVFGSRHQFSAQLKVPVTGIVPDAGPARFGLGAIAVAFTWSFFSWRQMRQYLGLGLQIPTASTAAVGGPWALVPTYAIAVSLARWLSLTVQIVWSRSLGTSSSYGVLNLLVVEPIVVFNLPGRSFLALDTRLGWDFSSSTFVPLLKGVAGLYVDPKKALAITAWVQTTLTSESASVLFRYGVGFGLAYFFDW